MTARCVRSVNAGGACCLPASCASKGSFRIGDSVTCVNESGQEVARGLASYSSIDVVRLAGERTNAIERVLGYSNGDEIIHRDDLVLLHEMRD